MHFIGRRRVVEKSVCAFSYLAEKAEKMGNSDFSLFFRGWGCQSAKAFLLLSSVYFPLSAKTSESVKDSVF